MKVVYTAEGKKFFFKGKDLHTQFGFISKQDVEKAKPGSVLTTNTGKNMTLTDGSFMDEYRKIKRGAQIIPLKDVGLIIVETGINKQSKVLEAGSGSGALCCFLAHIAGKVTTYEVREDFFKIVKSNIELLGLKNVTQKQADIYEGISEKNLDVVLFDLPEPWKAIKHAYKALKHGGYLVNYNPCVPQVSDLVEAARVAGFIHLKTSEIIERDWDVMGRKLRPKSQAIGHSGFVSFCRKL